MRTDLLDISFNNSIEYLLEYFLLSKLIMIPYLLGQLSLMVELSNVRIKYFIILAIRIININNEIMTIDQCFSQLFLYLVHVFFQQVIISSAYTEGMSQIEFMVQFLTIQLEVLQQFTFLQLQFFGGKDHWHSIVINTFPY